MRRHASLLAALLPLFAAWAGHANAQQPVQQQEPKPDSGFELVVVGSMPNVEPGAFTKAIAEALPTQLVDRQTNFTRSTAYKPGDSYRLAMVFHADDVVDGPKLCQQPSDVSAAPPADPGDLRATTHVTGVFCRNDQVLSQATDRMTGSVQPGQAGFRFLVADVAKQLFPDGFAAMPGMPDSVATRPGGGTGATPRN